MFNPFQTFLDIFGLQLSDLYDGKIDSCMVTNKGGGSVWSHSNVPFADFIIPAGKSYPEFSSEGKSYVIVEKGTEYKLYFFN